VLTFLEKYATTEYKLMKRKDFEMYIVRDAATKKVVAGMFEPLESLAEAEGAADYLLEKGFVENVIVERIEDDE
jgi:hypothetical protein